MKKITSLFLVALLVLSIIPITAAATEKIVITEINASFDFSMPSYGDAIDRTPFEITVEGDIPVSITSQSFDWYMYLDDNFRAVREGYFTEGLWCYDLKVELTDSENYTYDSENGTALIVNGVEWDEFLMHDAWVLSPAFEIEHIPGKIPLSWNSTMGSFISGGYIGEAIDPFNVSIGAMGGTKPYTFSKTSGPDWLNVSENGIITGTPTETGENEQLRVTVTDALGTEVHLDMDVGNTYIKPEDRTVISRVEANVEFPEFYCGYTLDGEYESTVSVGYPAYVSVDSSDFYPVDGEGNIGSATRTLCSGKFIMDLEIRIDGDDGYTHVLDEENLEVIINGVAVEYDYVSVGDDYSYVWVYLPEFTVDHVFDNDTDATCNGCDFIRGGCDHQYDNFCDDSCNKCGETRDAGHEYDAICDDVCNICKGKREAEPHTFEDCYDGYCSYCGYERETPAHIYDDCADSVCNLCEETRNVPIHSYSDYLDTTCDYCGANRTINTISLNEAKNVNIDVGGSVVEFIFVPTISGEFVFEAFAESDTYGYVFDENGEKLWYDDDDGEGNQFKIQETFEEGKTYILKVRFYSPDETGVIPFSISCVHDFVDDCDSDCGLCSLVREAPHYYDNTLDATCNECDHVRELNFIGVNETKIVEITPKNNSVEFVFTPAVSGEYTFIGLGNSEQDTYGYLYDSNYEILSSDDDSGEDTQFKITYYMNAGETYILSACFYGNSKIGSFPVSLRCEHSFDDEFDNKCNVCGEERETEQSVNVLCKGDLDFTLSGNIVTVNSEYACKVGYLVGDKYESLEGENNHDGTYSYEIPDDVTDILIVVKGDVNGDATVDSTDYMRIKNAFLGTFEFDVVNAFAGEVTGDDIIDSTDYMRIKNHFLGTFNLHG